MSKQVSVMHDIETMSTAKNAAIVSIGAVKFDGTNIVSTFYANIDPLSCKQFGLHFDPDTIEWWKRQKPEAYEALKHNRVSLPDALNSYSEWYGTKSMWTFGNGAEFDNVIIENAYKVIGMTAPWKYWDSMCYRTIVNLFNAKISKEVREGVHHNALDDATSQANNLMRIFNKT